jgi:hypothetical protein
MADVRGYTISDARPKIAEAYWPYFILRLQTTEGPQVRNGIVYQPKQLFSGELARGPKQRQACEPIRFAHRN